MRICARPGSEAEIVLAIEIRTAVRTRDSKKLHEDGIRIHLQPLFGLFACRSIAVRVSPRIR